MHGLGVDIREEDAKDLSEEFRVQLDVDAPLPRRLFAQVLGNRAIKNEQCLTGSEAGESG
jgi:hypothetical protein